MRPTETRHCVNSERWLRQIVSIHKHSGDPSIFLSAYFQKGERHDVNNDNISTALKLGAAVLD